jgi:hypothetical protein
MPSSTPRDLCKGVRECYTAILRAVVMNSWIAGACMGLPTYFLLAGISFQSSLITLYPGYSHVVTSASGPFYTVFTFTVLAWLVELAGIRWKLPNLLHMCAFGHAAVGSWWLVNLVILFFAGWYYIAFGMMWKLLSALIAPAVIWHITGDIIRAYKQKLLDEIANHQAALAQQGEAFTGRDALVGAEHA